MFKFETVTLGDAELKVHGPVEGDAERASHLIFMIGQGDVSADAHANPGWSAAEGWDGQVSSQGFQPGPAQAVGVAVMLSPGAPPALPSYETFTWAQQVEITATESAPR
jgi:hypothetical protein